MSDHWQQSYSLCVCDLTCLKLCSRVHSRPPLSPPLSGAMMYRGYKRSRRPQELGFSAELLLRRRTAHMHANMSFLNMQDCQDKNATCCCFCWLHFLGKIWNIGCLLIYLSVFNREVRLNELHMDGLLGKEGEVRVGECGEEREGRRRSQESRNAARFDVFLSYLEPKFISLGWSNPVHTDTHSHSPFISLGGFTFTLPSPSQIHLSLKENS